MLPGIPENAQASWQMRNFQTMKIQLVVGSVEPLQFYALYQAFWKMTIFKITNELNIIYTTRRWLEKFDIWFFTFKKYSQDLIFVPHQAAQSICCSWGLASPNPPIGLQTGKISQSGKNSTIAKFRKSLTEFELRSNFLSLFNLNSASGICVRLFSAKSTSWRLELQPKKLKKLYTVRFFKSSRTAGILSRWRFVFRKCRTRRLCMLQKIDNNFSWKWFFFFIIPTKSSIISLGKCSKQFPKAQYFKTDSL